MTHHVWVCKPKRAFALTALIHAACPLVWTSSPDMPTFAFGWDVNHTRSRKVMARLVWERSAAGLSYLALSVPV